MVPPHLRLELQPAINKERFFLLSGSGWTDGRSKPQRANEFRDGDGHVVERAPFRVATGHDGRVLGAVLASFKVRNRQHTAPCIIIAPFYVADSQDFALQDVEIQGRAQAWHIEEMVWLKDVAQLIQVRGER